MISSTFSFNVKLSFFMWKITVKSSIILITFGTTWTHWCKASRSISGNKLGLTVLLISRPHHDWGQTTGLGRRLFVGSLCERGDDPLPVAQRTNLNHLESQDTMQGAVLQHVNTPNTVVARIQSKLIESHPKHTDTHTNLVACAPRWQASMGKRKWLSSIIQSQSVSP